MEEEKLVCAVCGIDAPRDDANYCYCCGANSDSLFFAPVIPKEFCDSPEEAEESTRLTLVRYKKQVQ